MTFTQQEAFRNVLIQRYPNIPLEALDSIVDREAGRMGNARLKPTSYVPLAIASVAGYVRHRMTNYDALLTRYMRHIARDRVRKDVDAIIIAWS